VDLSFAIIGLVINKGLGISHYLPLQVFVLLIKGVLIDVVRKILNTRLGEVVRFPE
jgi:hypothetical protein